MKIDIKRIENNDKKEKYSLYEFSICVQGVGIYAHVTLHDIILLRDQVDKILSKEIDRLTYDDVKKDDEK